MTVHRLLDLHDVRAGDTVIVSSENGSALDRQIVVVGHIREASLERFRSVYRDHTVRLVIEDDDEALRQDLEEISTPHLGDEESDYRTYLDSLERVSAIARASLCSEQNFSVRKQARLKTDAADAVVAAAAQAVRDEARAAREREEDIASRARLAEASEGWD